MSFLLFSVSTEKHQKSCKSSTSSSSSSLPLPHHQFTTKRQTHIIIIICMELFTHFYFTFLQHTHTQKQSNIFSTLQFNTKNMKSEKSNKFFLFLSSLALFLFSHLPIYIYGSMCVCSTSEYVFHNKIDIDFCNISCFSLFM